MSSSRPPASDPTIGRLVTDVTSDISALLRSEIKLLKTELRVSVKSGGIGAGLLVVAAFLGLLLIIMLSITAAYFLTMTGLHPAWAFLIVSGFYVLLIVLLAIGGVLLLRKVRAPERAIESAKEIPAALKGQPSPKSRAVSRT